MKLSHTIRPTFDDPNVVSDAGVVPALRLGESAGLYDLLEEALTVELAERDGEDDLRGGRDARRRRQHR